LIHKLRTRLYVHNLLSPSVYPFTFFHTPTISTQSSFTFSIPVHILSHPHYKFTIFFHIHHCVHILSHIGYMFRIFLSHSTFTLFRTPTICAQSSFTFSTYVHILSHPGYIFTIFFHIQRICRRSADYRSKVSHSAVTFAPDSLLQQLLSHSHSGSKLQE
jgi:hypothetical protein